MFNRVRIRLTLLTVSISLIVYIVSTAAVFTIVRDVVLHAIDIRLSQTAERLVANPEGTLAHIPPDASLYAMIRRDGKVYTNMPQSLEQGLVIRFVQAGFATKRFSLLTDSTSYRGFYFALPSPNGGGRNYGLLVADDMKEMNILHRLRVVVTAVGVGGAILSTIAGFFLAERVLRPIRKAWQKQLEFAANASHELRTPLAVIQSNLGVVLEHTDENVVDNLEWLNNAHSEARRLSRLVQDLLTLARSDSENAPIQRVRVDLFMLLDHVCDLFEGITTAKEIKLTTNLAPAVCIVGEQDRLHQLFVIVLDNACKFTDANGTVQVSLTRQKHYAVVEVIDSGHGIPSAHLPHIFERFYTGDAARSRAGERSTGLGLAIAHWIVDVHQGRIQVTSDGPERGTSVRIELPLAP